VGPVGTDLGKLDRLLKKELREVGYNGVDIHLSHLFHELPKFQHLKNMSGGEDIRINEHMEAGNEIRRIIGSGDSVARLGISEIRRIRANKVGSPDRPIPQQAYILNSLKHPHEIQTLKRLYGDSFLLISMYQPWKSRIQSLAGKIRKSYKSTGKKKYEDEAEKLVEKDSKEFGDEFGQSVRDAFPLADLFVSEKNSVSGNLTIEEQVRRFIQLLFGAPFITPTIDEYGIFHAKAAALRSAD